jgi:hypothetical protein
MSRAGAWLLDLGDCRAAVGVREQVHLVHEPATAELAGAPAHCRHVIFWNGRCVPVMDLDRWLHPTRATDPATGPRCLGIYAYQPDVDAAVEFGALWLAGPPQRIDVDDASATPLPPGARWPAIASACFTGGSGPVPILDLPRIFSSALDA